MARIKKVAAFIVNYNMPERATALAEHIKERSNWAVDVYLIDNGSDLVEPSPLTNIKIEKNVQTTNGWLAGLNEIDKRGKRYFAYWFLITSARFVDDRDVLSPMAQFLFENKNAVGIHPALTPESTTVWKHLYSRGTSAPRQTKHIDNIASLYRADWFDEIGRFDPALTMAHGICLETCWKARRQGRSIWVDERVSIEKITDIGYSMNRMHMSAERRRELARAEMDKVLIPRYGPHYWYFLQYDSVTKEME